ncbi:MAG: CDF family Co(II)/Ni(II) efflux transporter DmeF [Alphaproteobacteria bacterium]|nr:CDF family Co(II)/Ni(II) efflux transporter DmeF [Alphaproteobacteria bacterium]
MHLSTTPQHAHEHFFLHDQHGRSEQRTRMVVALTAGMMVAEVAAGTVFRSMALVADGWHMASHVAALSLAAFAYSYARRHAHDARYSFGTGKVGALAGYTSAVVLGMIALAMGYDSVERLIAPVPIDFTAATWVAALGLVVNLASAALLGHAHDHDDDHDHDHERHDHDHAHDHTDHNLRSAYVHVLADAFTSLTAIVALTGGRFLGWVWLDPMMGLVGMGVILAWSWGLIRDCRQVLLDADVSPKTIAEIRRRIEGEADSRITDLHVWRVSSHHLAAIISLMTHEARPPEHYKALLKDLELAHVTVEVVPCPGAVCHA